MRANVIALSPIQITALTPIHIYDEAAGLPDEDIPAGTKWEDVPPNWTCPECGARKDDFEMVEF